jgi:alpha-1,6-mannosyltransferase
MPMRRTVRAASSAFKDAFVSDIRDWDMRVLDLAEFYSERGGGVRSYLDRMLQHAGALGHELLVVAPGPRDEDTRVGDGGRIVRYRAPRMPYDPSYHAPIAISRMRALVRELRPDVLQLSSPFIPLWVGASLEVPLRAYVHHADPIGCYLAPLVSKHRAARPLESAAWNYLRRATGRCDVTIVAGEWLARELQIHGCPRVRTVLFGIDHTQFSPERRDESLRRDLMGPLADDPAARLVLVGGRLAADKRQALVLEALELLARKRPIALVLLGDGPERENLEALGRKLPSFRSLRFTRDRDEYSRLLASVDALGHGSLCETFGFLLAECLASGTPLVVPDRGGAADLADGPHAERYGAFDGPAALADALGRLLEKPRAELSALARARATIIPTTRGHFSALFDTYTELLAGRA